MWTGIQIVGRSSVSRLVLFCRVPTYSFFSLIVVVSSFSFKMFIKCMWMLGLTISIMIVYGESSPGTLRDTSSYPRVFNRHISNVHSPRTQWTYRPPQEDFHRYAFEGISHGSTLKATGSSYERQNESGSPQEYWWSNPGWQNYTSANYYGSSKPLYGYLEASSGATGFYYKDPVEKSHSRYPYRQIQPVTGSHIAIKNTPLNKEKLQVLSVDTKHKFKKTVSHPSVPDYKKIVFSGVAKPHGKHKYFAQNHPLYKRYYYQSPYQRYSIPSSEILRYKDMNPSEGHFKKSTASPNQDPGRHYTTERMDDAYPDGSATLEDYSSYNDTNHNTNGNYYEETYEEVEKTASDSEEGPEEEGTTRGYYGDRIYMSTQMPLVISDKTGVKNKYYIIRRTSHDDDIETLFE